MEYIIYNDSDAQEIKCFASILEASKYAKDKHGKKASAELYNTSIYKMIVEGKMPMPKHFKKI